MLLTYFSSHTKKYTNTHINYMINIYVSQTNKQGSFMLKCIKNIFLHNPSFFFAHLNRLYGYYKMNGKKLQVLQYK